MILVRHTSLGGVGEIRPGKTLIPVTHNEETGCYQVQIEDSDTTAIAFVLSLGFVTADSPLANPAPVAPAPSIEVVVVEREPAPEKKTPSKKKSSRSSKR